uniref:Interferon alpha beta n=1 Tax=Andrias davidianus TaxID=141262 RepID=A0A0E3M476_ANDDA|nr:interferon alpha beta [Andrias davidianus]AKG95506.1 type I interferon [Andrias davidianus]
MATTALRLACLFVLFGTQAFCWKCMFSYNQQHTTNTDCIQLLEQMGGHFPLQCLSEKMTIKFPHKVLIDKHLQTRRSIQLTLNNIFHGINNILSKNKDKSGWDTRKSDLFKLRLELQNDILGKCLSKHMVQKRGRVLQIKRYFKKIEDFLREKEYSLCAWENVRAELKNLFVHVDKITAKITKLQI